MLLLTSNTKWLKLLLDMFQTTTPGEENSDIMFDQQAYSTGVTQGPGVNPDVLVSIPSKPPPSKLHSLSF